MAPNTGLPLGSAMLNPIEYMKQAWSSFNLPSQFAPTLDLNELDRRITDLKAVEQWLNMNLGLLRNTIQGLEIQRGTIATVAAFGQAFERSGGAMAELAQKARQRSDDAPAGQRNPFTAEPSQQAPATDQATGAEAEQAAGDGGTSAPAASSPSLFSELARLSGLAGFGGFGNASPQDSDVGTGPASSGTQAEATAPSTGEGSAATAGANASEAAPQDQAGMPASTEASHPTASAAASALASAGQMAETVAASASSAWWNMLQGQFNQIVAAALSPGLPSVFGGAPVSGSPTAPASTAPANAAPPPAGHAPAPGASKPAQPARPGASSTRGKPTTGGGKPATKATAASSTKATPRPAKAPAQRPSLRSASKPSARSTRRATDE